MSDMTWVPCAERLPEKGELVITAIYGSDMIIRRDSEMLEEAVIRSLTEPARTSISFLGDDGYWCDGYFGGPEIIEPTFWMPFPEPPENPRPKQEVSDGSPKD